MLTLSILTCSVDDRADKLARLKTAISASIGKLPVEHLCLSDNRQMPIGKKRNELLMMAKGEYCSFVDDDDTIDPLYVKLICDAVVSKPDCVGICGNINIKGQQWQFRHSITVGRWCKDKVAHIYFRTPNHLNPIKREYCIRAQFPGISFGEDKIYSDRIRPYLKTESFIERPIYFYTPSEEAKK